MNSPVPEFLTTREVADLLRIKERRLYDLAAAGEIPCTRALGKLLFQRSQINAWLASHGTGSVTGSVIQIPRVVLGSQDPMLEWALREAGTGLATFLDGSLDGLERFAALEGIVTGMHFHAPGSQEWNSTFTNTRFAAENVVLLEWAWRDRGLIVAPGNPKQIQTMSDLAGLRTTTPQGAAKNLFAELLAEAGREEKELAALEPVRNETDATLAVSEGRADAALGLSSLARQYRLDFIPVLRERFDLLVRRNEWFDEPMQRLIAFTRTAAFQARAAAYPDYDFSQIWQVHYNSPAQ